MCKSGGGKERKVQTLILAFQISGEGFENSGYGQFWSFS